MVDRLVASGEARPMVIVTPDAGGGDPNVYQNGYFDMDGWKYETFFFTELVPFIESNSAQAEARPTAPLPVCQWVAAAPRHMDSGTPTCSAPYMP